MGSPIGSGRDDISRKCPPSAASTCVAAAGGIAEKTGCREIGPSASYVGCNTHGQIARAEGQFGGFHNCTAVVCVLPA